MDSVQNDNDIELTRSEKTVLTDAFNWYITDYEWCEFSEKEIEQMEELIEYTNENSQLKLMPGLDNVITNEILPNFGQALKEYIDATDNPEETGTFYKTQFENIQEKIEDAETPKPAYY